MEPFCARHEDLMATRRLATDLAEKNSQLEDAQNEVTTLKGLIPICASCKSIRDDEGYWEGYVMARSSAVFSHGICPDCAARVYPGLK